MEEVVSLRKRQSLIVVVPTDVRSEDSELKKNRKQFKKRLVGHIASSHPNLRRDEVIGYLNEHHGITRNQSTYIELACVVKAYGERDDLMNDRNLDWHLGRGSSGPSFDLLDFPASKSLQIKMKEASSVQFWVEHFRGDLRPRVQLKQIRVLEKYCDELHNLLDAVKDDPLQTLELALEFQACKSKILTGDLNAAKASTAKDTSSAKGQQSASFELALENELIDNNLENFAVKTDLRYKEAFHRAYSNFQSQESLMSDDITQKIMKDLKLFFPLHFQAFRSLIFTKRNHQPADRVKPFYARKCKSLVNHVCAMVRLRNPQRLIHWSTVATMAMWKKGMTQRVSRNPVFKAFSITPRSAFNLLDRIYEETEQDRRQVMSLQQIGSHSSDNYNQYHAHSIQVTNKAGIMHLGMVYNLIRCKEWNKPSGTVYKDPNGRKWIVVKSRLKDCFTCEVTITQQREGDAPFVSFQKIVKMPCIGWTITYLPGVPATQPGTTTIPLSIAASQSIKMGGSTNVASHTAWRRSCL